MWHYIHQRLLISLTVICLLLVGLGNALHTYANDEGQVPDMLTKLPGQLKFVHVVRAIGYCCCFEHTILSRFKRVSFPDISPRRQNAR